MFKYTNLVSDYNQLAFAVNLHCVVMVTILLDFYLQIFASSRCEDELHPLQSLTQQTSFLKYRTCVHLKKPILPLFHVLFFNSLKVSPHALIATQSTSKLPSVADSADIYSEIMEDARDTISMLQMVANSQFQECLWADSRVQYLQPLKTTMDSLQDMVGLLQT